MAFRIALWLLLSAAISHAQETPMSRLAFMAGCWRGTLDDGTIIEERYTKPTPQLMLGTSLYLKGVDAMFFELTTVQRLDDGGIALTPYPAGEKSVPFRLITIEGEKAVFENPDHDFPKRITYERGKDGRLTARLEGVEKGKAMTEDLRMAPCAEP